MSEEFLKVATKEIKEDLENISTILGSCQNDDDVSKNSDEIEKFMHKIKGLAPMMGKQDVGDLAKTLDVILKKINSGQKIDGFLEPLSISVEKMTSAIDGPTELGQVQQQISDIASKIVD